MAQSFARFMYCCLSTFGGIKIFWYVCKMRGQVNKILPGSCISVAGSLALAVEIECRKSCPNLFGYVLIVMEVFIKATGVSVGSRRKQRAFMSLLKFKTYIYLLLRAKAYI